MNRESDPQAGEHVSDAERLAPLLRRLLAELDGIERRAVVGGASRRLIRHSRSLDSLLWQAHRYWKQYNRDQDPDILDALRRTLNEAQKDADQLQAALEVTSAPLTSRSAGTPPETASATRQDARYEGPAEIDEVRRRIGDLLDGLEPGSPPVGVDDSVGMAAPAREPPAEAVPAAEEDETSALEGMLWRITSEWQHLQRSPSPDRIALLCDKLERASQEVRRLASDIEDASLRAAPAAAAPVAEPSAHPPFRDSLTGALSREGFDTLVIGELKRSRRYRRPFTLLLVEAPDGEASEMAETLERLAVGLRGSDYVGRYVDRLVAVGLPETTSEAALVAARRVMRSMAAAGADTGAMRVGLASLPEDGRTLAELAALARRQLRNGPGPADDSGRDYWGV